MFAKTQELANAMNKSVPFPANLVSNTFVLHSQNYKAWQHPMAHCYDCQFGRNLHGLFQLRARFSFAVAAALTDSLCVRPEQAVCTVGD